MNFLYFHNFVAKSDQKPKMKNGMNETLIITNLFVEIVFGTGLSLEMQNSRCKKDRRSLMVRKSEKREKNMFVPVGFYNPIFGSNLAFYLFQCSYYVYLICEVRK